MVVMEYIEVTRASSAATLSRIVMHTHNACVRIAERTPLPQLGSFSLPAIREIGETENFWMKLS